jgi:4-amino-4-deoxy-L-arabinose transferase-like glycosyltransferase
MRSTGSTQLKKRLQVSLGILVLAALGLRLTNLTFQPLWWDEGWSLYFATADVKTLFELTAVDIHPPLYYLLLQGWMSVLGRSEEAVRLLSVFLGTATVPLLYAAGRRLVGRQAGLIAAALLAASPLHIYYSQEVRMYGLVTLLSLAAVHWGLSWDVREGSRGRKGQTILILYVLTATAALYTQYYAGFLLLALNLIILVRWLRSRESWRNLVAWLSAQVLVLLLFAPWIWYAGEKLTTYIRYKVGVEQDPSLDLLSYLTRHLAAFDWGHAEGALQSWWWVGLLPLGIILPAIVLAIRHRFGQNCQQVSSTGVDGARVYSQIWRRPGQVWAITFIAMVTLASGFVVNLFFPFNPPRSERLMLLALPCYLLAVAAALSALWRSRRWWAWAAIGSFLIATLVSLGYFHAVPRYPNDDYRPVAERVAALGLPTDAVVCVQPWQVGYFQTYIPDNSARPNLVLTPREVVPNERQIWYDDPARMAADLDQLLAENQRIWFPDHRSMGRVLEEQIEVYLAEQAYPVLTEWHGDSTVLSLFVSGGTEALQTTARFGEWLSLDSVALSSSPVEAGWGVVSADLKWRLSENPGERYHVGLRLVDGTGRTWAQRDSTPRSGLQHFFEWGLDELILDRHGLLVPAGTPPGDYAVTLRVYRSRDIAVLPAVFEGGSGGELTLGMVRVKRPDTPPPVQALSIPTRTNLEWGDHLTLLGVNSHTYSGLLPGESIEVDLFWQVRGAPGEDYLPSLQLIDSEGASQARVIEKPVAGTYPTAWWQAGELIRDPHELPIPATVPPGQHSLTLSLVRAADGQPLPLGSGQKALEIAQIEVESRDHHFWPLLPAHAQTVDFGSYIELTGYDMREAVRAPGSPLEVTLYWHALQTPDRNYHTFVHLLDDSDEISAQHDGQPGGGRLPTLGWLPSEYLTDTHLLQLPFDLADGVYRLGVGFYEPATGIRLGERVLLDKLVPIRSYDGCYCR